MENKNKAVQFLVRFGKSLVIPVGMWLIFAIISGGRTASVKMLMNTLRQSVVPCIICYGLMLNMSVGMMNFSAGGMIIFAGIVGGNLAKITNTGVTGLVLFVVSICILEGMLTGLLYNAMRVPCIVLSIGMMLIWEALPRVLFEGGLNLNFKWTYLARSPHCFLILALCLAVFYVIYNKTAFGHNLRAIGSNQAIANSVGLSSDKIKFLSFTLGAVFLGVAGVLYMSERGEVRNVTTMGSMTIMMDGFMGMFIAMFLSKYCDMSIAVVLGTFTMKMLANGFVALGLSATVRDIVQGLFLLLLLTISANAGFFDRRKADKAFAEKCNAEYRQTGAVI